VTLGLATIVLATATSSAAEERDLTEFGAPFLSLLFPQIPIFAPRAGNWPLKMSVAAARIGP
jgi:hypothetical protein